VEEQEEQRDGWQMELRRDANENGSRGWLTLHLSTGIIALTLLLLLFHPLQITIRVGRYNVWGIPEIMSIRKGLQCELYTIYIHKCAFSTFRIQS